MRLDEIARYLNGKLAGPPQIEISGPAKIEQAGPGEITFLSNLKYRHFISKTQASAIVVDREIDGLELPHILVANAYVGFVMLLKLFQPVMHDYFEGLSENAFIDKTARIGPGARIAALAYIGPNVTIGKNTVIYPGVVLLKNVRIGDDCILYPNVSVREECQIGNRVILQNGCVIGSDGFGFAPQDDAYLKIPQIGTVIIEDDVELGANTTVDRSTLGATVLKQGCKMDNLVQIAHNVLVGKHTVMASQSGIAGSTELGDHVTIGGQVGITGHIKIDDNVIVAAQSGVTKSLKQGEIYWGTPAIPITTQKKMDVSLRRLPDLIKKVRMLEKEIVVLKKQIAKEKTER